MKHLMVDIETLGMPPKGALLQIGACMFEPDRAQSVEELIADSFLVSIQRGFYEGLRDEKDWIIEPRTVTWWSKQSEEAQASLEMGLVSSPREALLKFTRWLDAAGFEYAAKNSRNVQQIWANPPTFDLAILSHAYEVCDLRRPWHYRQEKDARTLMWLAENVMHGTTRKELGWDKLTGHRGDHDAIRQVLYVQRALGEYIYDKGVA